MTCEIKQGDCLEVLKTLDSESVQCCVTSPPYFGLRDYGTATWEGGDVECDHEPPQEWIDHMFNANSAFGSGAATQSAAGKKRWYKSDGSCPQCGAVRADSQIGLENTPQAYVTKLVQVFDEVHRVLKPDGTCWLNLGDSFFNTQNSNRNGLNGTLGGTVRGGGRFTSPKRTPGELNLKPKDLIGIPWRVAFALQEAGWYLRQDIIWAKPNPMPESVTDRCTKSHEYIFLLTKNARYYYNSESIAEPFADNRMGNPNGGGQYARDAFAYAGPNAQSGLQKGEWNVNGDKVARNKRSVWTVTTQPYSEAHFATFPAKLIEPCILAGSKEGDTVLDPFNGSGTTGMVSLQHRRNYIGIELNPEYIKIAEKRLTDVQVKLF